MFQQQQKTEPILKSLPFTYFYPIAMKLQNFKDKIVINNEVKFQNPILNGSRFTGRALSGIRLAPGFFKAT